MIIHCDSTKYIYEVLENGEYSYLFNGLKVLDLGCNVGAFSLWIYPHAEKIWAVDRDEECINLFKQTIKDNNMDRIKPFVSRIHGRDTLAGFMSGNAIGKIDVLKMDIEGDELSVVQAEDFPAHLIVTIIGEHHYQDPEHATFIRRLNELGYTYHELPNNHFICRK